MVDQAKYLFLLCVGFCTAVLQAGPHELQQKDWQFNQSNVLKADNHLNISFSPDRLSVSGGCNRMSGGVSYQGDASIKLGPMMGTLMACSGDRMKIDQEVIEFFNQGKIEYNILNKDNQDFLILQNPNDQYIEWK